MTTTPTPLRLVAPYLDASFPPQSICDFWSEETEERLFFEFWSAHALWLSDVVGWDRANQRGIYTAPHASSQHRTIDRLRRFIQATGLVNAHFGLTSSDVEDNVQRSQLAVSMHCLSAKLEYLLHQMSSSFPDDMQIPAFTHLQHAGAFSLHHRVAAWLTPLEINIRTMPVVHAKFLGGSVGDAMELIELVKRIKRMNRHAFGNLDEVGMMYVLTGFQRRFPWKAFMLQAPLNTYPTQSADYMDEFEAVSWMAKCAAQLHKIALDLRLMQGQGLVRQAHDEGYRGSSSIQEKNNPIGWEKACSIARTILPLPQEILTVIAHNALERTLDTSWQLRQTLATSTQRFEKLLDTMTSSTIEVGPFAPRHQPDRHKPISSVLDLGQSRIEVYDSLS